MANPRAALNVTSAYDAFLYASMDNEPGAMPLSVLSALARLNVDPWDEAARLAALTTSEAERILASMLELLPGPRQSAPQARIAAARLVALLPKARATSAKVPAILADEERTIFWVAWLCFGIFIWILAPHLQETAPRSRDSTPASSAAASPESRSAAPVPVNANNRAAADKVHAPEKSE